MSNIIKEFRLGELFCGPGGLALVLCVPIFPTSSIG